MSNSPQAAHRRVRTRFAPSPTGHLHIGGARTALFDYFFARSQGGDFILRIEDTDQTRYVEGAVEDIIEGMKWLGIEIDEGPVVGGPYAPYYQSERKDIYRKYTDELIEKGCAYPCFCSPEKLDKMREDQKTQSEKPTFIGYDRSCRDLSPEEVDKHLAAGENPVVRFKIPIEGETTFQDSLRGNILVPNSSMDDFVILKRDGMPTYHLASVIDDYLMEISHVFRGEEWIPSAGKHQLLYDAFGWEPPIFVHLPVILSPKGGKLSKRDGATHLKEFKESGYLSDALVNFLVLLGWSYDDKTEILSLDTLCKEFELSHIRKGSPTFFYDKLDHFNGVYIRNKTIAELRDLCRPFMVQAHLLPENPSAEIEAYYLAMLPLIQERLKRLSEAPDQLRFFLVDSIQIDDTRQLIPKKSDNETTVKVITALLKELETAQEYTPTSLEQILKELVGKLQVQPQSFFMAIRLALTGSTVSPGLFESMYVLGRLRVAKRLKEALNQLTTL